VVKECNYGCAIHKTELIRFVAGAAPRQRRGPMAGSEPTDPVRAFVDEHRDQLETYAGSEKETAWLAEGLLVWVRPDGQTAESQEGRP
jgi:hypothetical protein